MTDRKVHDNADLGVLYTDDQCSYLGGYHLLARENVQVRLELTVQEIRFIETEVDKTLIHFKMNDVLCATWCRTNATYGLTSRAEVAVGDLEAQRITEEHGEGWLYALQLDINDPESIGDAIFDVRVACRSQSMAMWAASKVQHLIASSVANPPEPPLCPGPSAPPRRRIPRKTIKPFRLPEPPLCPTGWVPPKPPEPLDAMLGHARGLVPDVAGRIMPAGNDGAQYGDAGDGPRYVLVQNWPVPNMYFYTLGLHLEGTNEGAVSHFIHRHCIDQEDLLAMAGQALDKIMDTRVMPRWHARCQIKPATSLAQADIDHFRSDAQFFESLMCDMFGFRLLVDEAVAGTTGRPVRA